jgi:putative ABC transport system ATP-binding protein
MLSRTRGLLDLQLLDAQTADLELLDPQVLDRGAADLEPTDRQGADGTGADRHRSEGEWGSSRRPQQCGSAEHREILANVHVGLLVSGTTDPFTLDRLAGIEAGTATPTRTIVACEGLSRRYGEGDAAVDALRGVSLQFPAGEMTAIVGPSGSGKSTLMHLLAGLDKPTAGKAWIDDVEVTALDDKGMTKLRREKLGFIFQFFNLVPVLDAAENVELPLRIAGTDVDEAWRDRLLETVGLSDRATHRPAELSGGQQQRVAIARALIARPAVVFADEPTGNLDSKSGGGVLDLLRRSVDEFDQTVIVVTHDPKVAAVADRVIVLADGAVAADRRVRGEDDVIDLMRDI